MKKTVSLFLALTALLLSACESSPADTSSPISAEATASADTGTESLTTAPEETKDIIRETEENSMFTELFSNLSEFPFSFVYDGIGYTGFSDEEFTKISSDISQYRNGTKTKAVFTHKKSGAEFVLDLFFYPDYSAYEYKVTVNNNTSENTKCFADLYFCNTFDVQNAKLSGLNGDAGGQYVPYTTKIREKSTVKQSTGGRPTHGAFPYFDINGDNGGYLFAIGWSGCWKAEFYTVDGSPEVLAGQHNLDTYLTPGESIRSPLFAVVKYDKDATNAWRHYYINCVMPQPNGKNVPTLLGTSKMADGFNEAKAVTLLKAYANHGINFDFFWLDAGWYTGASNETVSWPQTGTLNIDTSRYTNKFKDISSYLHGINAKFLLWFEPEVVRVDKDEFLKFCTDFKEEWYLGTAAKGTWLEGQLIDLGNPECVNWLLEKITKIMTEGGVDVYRQDFNVDPADVWKSHNSKGREGITENKYVVGYLAFWDTLLERFPGLIIDSCASGGGRNDLESMKRAVPLHYSDWFDGNNEDYSMKQSMTQELFAWFPYFKNEVYQSSMYKFRANYACMFILKVPSPILKSVDWSIVLKAQEEYNIIRKYLYSDYYKLFDYSKKENRYNGWMFFDSGLGEGYVEILRNEKSTEPTVTVALKGLDPEKTYSLKDFDGLINLTAKGSELLSGGITLTTPEAPYAAIILIKEVK